MDESIKGIWRLECKSVASTCTRSGGDVVDDMVVMVRTHMGEVGVQGQACATLRSMCIREEENATKASC